MLDALDPLTDQLERISRSVPSEEQEDEEDQGLDLQLTYVGVCSVSLCLSGECSYRVLSV